MGRGLSHAGQAVTGECVGTRYSWSQYSHMRGVPSFASLVIGQGQIVAARVYLACSWEGVRHGLAMECWQEGIFRVRARLCSACVMDDCG